jgi:hypothetical protein
MCCARNPNVMSDIFWEEGVLNKQTKHTFCYTCIKKTYCVDDRTLAKKFLLP